MKSVFSNRMVAHVWAQQSQAEGRGHNFYFRDSTIYSYGAHFPIARFVTRKGTKHSDGGAKCVLFTTHSRSPSTSKHMAYTRRALHGLNLPIFHVTEVQDRGRHGEGQDTCHAVNKADFNARIQCSLEKASKARGRALYYLGCAQELTAEANAYAEWFKLRWRMANRSVSTEYIDTLREAAKKREAAAVAKHERELARCARLLPDVIAHWRAHTKPEYDTKGIFPADTLLRLSTDGTEVQTSRGAEVPVGHAARLWKVIQRVRAGGTPYERNGHTEHVGEFTVDKIEVTGDIKVGCHFIRYPEIERVAGDLGLIEVQS